MPYVARCHSLHLEYCSLVVGRRKLGKRNGIDRIRPINTEQTQIECWYAPYHKKNILIRSKIVHLMVEALEWN